MKPSLSAQRITNPRIIGQNWSRESPVSIILPATTSAIRRRTSSTSSHLSAARDPSIRDLTLRSSSPGATSHLSRRKLTWPRFRLCRRYLYLPSTQPPATLEEHPSPTTPFGKEQTRRHRNAQLPGKQQFWRKRASTRLFAAGALGGRRGEAQAEHGGQQARRHRIAHADAARRPTTRDRTSDRGRRRPSAPVSNVGPATWTRSPSPSPPTAARAARRGGSRTTWSGCSRCRQSTLSASPGWSGGRTRMRG